MYIHISALSGQYLEKLFQLPNYSSATQLCSGIERAIMLALLSRKGSLSRTLNVTKHLFRPIPSTTNSVSSIHSKCRMLCDSPGMYRNTLASSSQCLYSSKCPGKRPYVAKPYDKTLTKDTIAANTTRYVTSLFASWGCALCFTKRDDISLS